MEVRSLLSWVMLDTSVHRSGNLTPRRLNPVVILTPPPHKPKELPKPVDTSSQVSTLEDIEMAEASLEGVPTTIPPVATTTRSRSITPPKDTGELWEKANKALEELLATKSSIDAHRWGAIWELGMELCQNESETAESIKEARAICSCITMDAEALCFSTVKEAKVTCIKTIKEAKATNVCTIQEAKTTCSVAIRDAKTWGASQAKSLHRQHAKTIQDLEEQVIQEEGRSQTDFLSACHTALHASPAELKGMLVGSYHILMGQAPTSHPFTLSQGACPAEQLYVPAAPPMPAPTQSPRPKRWHPSQDPVDSMPLGWTTSKATSEWPPAPNSERSHLWTRYSSRAVQKHSPRTLTWWRRLGRSILKGIPTASLQRAPTISEVFRQMAKSADLLDTAIHEIQEVWMGPDELWQANYALRSLPKGLKFLHAVPLSQSPKVMGLVGIHDLDALCCFNGLTHCPWCGKEGQNEGTVINHLQTVHYRLGLVCNKCNNCPSTSSDTLHHHGQQNCQHSGEWNLNESVLSE